MNERVLVTDGEQRAALAIVRSLGAAGETVFVCSSRSRSLAGASRFTRGEARVPDPLSEPAEYVASVRELIERWSLTAIIPTTEAAILALLPERENLGVRIPFAELEAFRAISDKQAVLEAASRVGIRVPGQWVVDDPAAVPTFRPDSISFPVVIKPARSIGEWKGERRKLSVSYASSWEELQAAMESAPPAAFPLLLQQRIIGPGTGLFFLMWGGQVLASFAHRRIREKPPAGGVSVYRESVAIDPQLLARAVDLLQQFEWEGVAMVEFKVDEATGTHYLMEINGRFWGSLQLAVDAGVDFPALLLAASRGEVEVPRSRYRLGVRSRWWWGDVDQLLTRLHRSGSELALPPGAPGRFRALLDFLVLWQPGDRNEIFKFQDPAPLLRETIDWIRRR